MIRIAIGQAAFEAIARTLPLGNVGYENKTNEQGHRLIWLDRAVVDRLRALRGAGESFSDVILRLVESEARPRWTRQPSPSYARRGSQQRRGPQTLESSSPKWMIRELLPLQSRLRLVERH
jgi:hypothetical protein